MPPAIIKLVLVLVLCIQATLWSISQQGTVHLRPESTNHLVPRADFGPQDYESFKKTCTPRSFPPEDQCSHVTAACPTSKSVLRLTYVRKYFCSSLPVRPGYFMGLVVWLIFLFSTLGISASDFFCPNLATISAILGLDENVAGVTFLALGNGSPDVFSTFSAMKAESGSLAIGELLGAATFIVSVVVGSMALIKPFKVNRGPFLRDVGFFTTAIVLLLAVLFDGIVKGWEAGLLVLLYAIYVAVVVATSMYEKRLERRKRKESLLRAQYGQDDSEEASPITTPYHDEQQEPYRDDATEATLSVPVSPISHRNRAHSNPSFPSESTSDPRLSLSGLLPPGVSRSRRSSHSGHRQNLPSYSLLGALEFRNAVNLLRQQSNAHIDTLPSPITPYAAGHYHNPILSGHSVRRDSQDDTDQESNPWESSLIGVPLDERPNGDSTLHPPTSQSQQLARASSINTNGDAEVSPTASASTSPTSEQPPKALPGKRQRIKTAIYHTLHTLFPTLHNFTQKSFVGMAAALFAAPAVLALTLTLPVVVTPMQDAEVEEKVEEATGPTLGNLIDFEEEGIERALVAEEAVEEEMHDLEFNKWLMAVQCVCAPLFCVSVLFGTNVYFPWLMIGAAVGGVIVAVLTILFANQGNDPAARVARTSMGFFVAVVWIMAIADEVVQVLQTFGLIFGLSDAIIGLTIFAVGNSLADFVANVTVAAFAPIMGFSACFGGPMLNILLGVGLSGTYLIRQTGQDYAIKLSTTLLVSSIGLLVLLVATMIFVPWNGYMLSRPWATFLIISYVVIMTINVVVEVRQDASASSIAYSLLSSLGFL
ncbi:hypothetical protein M408DRAFT_61176 [Serendipita vermifera MAFF 305830]|uniref:Sodium/calcium exchanger membrane region domain-containing protein n=1 Tax=Serendipita vermifera MAFF 305830 TaxID=933852 RepID=A0A0C3BMA2_SERVB|nr:hypothetical protein M408DRAFT_61176 [Serendipita vermifera MAFF 305830]